MDYDVLRNGAHRGCGADSLTGDYDGGSTLKGLDGDLEERRWIQAEHRRKAKAYWERKRAEQTEPVE